MRTRQAASTVKAKAANASKQGSLTALLSSASPAEQAYERLWAPFRCLIELISRQQQTRRTLLDWLRVEYGSEESSNKLLALIELDSNTKGESRKLKL
jgi:hypothetical protein